MEVAEGISRQEFITLKIPEKYTAKTSNFNYKLYKNSVCKITNGKKTLQLEWRASDGHVSIATIDAKGKLHIVTITSYVDDDIVNELCKQYLR